MFVSQVLYVVLMRRVTHSQELFKLFCCFLGQFMYGIFIWPATHRLTLTCLHCMHARSSIADERQLY